MSRALTPEDAMARIPGWLSTDAEIEAALPGLTNRSWRVRVGGDRYVLRLEGSHTAGIPLDRKTELVAHERAASARLAPPVIFADPGAGILVTRFATGRVLSPEDMRDARMLERLAELLQQIHALGQCGRPFDAAGAAVRYRDAIGGKEDAGAIASRCVEIVDSTPAPSSWCCCHNDVVAENLIECDGKLELLDWEYAGDNDPYFDLASPVAYHGLDRRLSDVLISAYAGGVDAEARERLAAFVRCHDALHWLWLARRQTIAPEPALAARLGELASRLT